MARPPSLADFAAACGVSKATASKALSPHVDRCDLAPETRERIRALAVTLGYQPDPSRRARSSNRSGNIGLVYQRNAPLTLGVYERLPDQLADALGARGLCLLFVPVAGPDAWPRRKADIRFDGAILVEPSSPALHARLAHDRFPAVVFNQRTPPALATVICDEAPGIDAAVRHFAALGHRRIAYLRNPSRQPHYSVEARRDAYLSAVRRLGLEALISECVAHELATAIAAARDPAATAVLAYNVTDAHDFLAAARGLGLRVPEDVSLIACDDMQIAAVVSPALTAVALPMTAMADAAATVIAQLLVGRAAPLLTSLPGTLVVRASTAAASLPQA